MDDQTMPASLEEVAERHAAAAEQAPQAPAGEQWAGPTPQEWQATMGAVAYLSNAIQAAEREQREAVEQAERERLEELLYEDPARFVDTVVQREIERQVAPVAQYVAELQREQELAEGEAEACALLAQFGVPEVEMLAVLEEANRYFANACASVGASTARELGEWIAERTGETVEEATRGAAMAMLAYAVECRARESARPRSLLDVARKHTSGTPVAQVGEGDLSLRALVAKHVERANAPH